MSHPAEQLAGRLNDATRFIPEQVPSLEHLDSVDGQLEVVPGAKGRFGQADLRTVLPIQNVGLGDAAVALAHQDRLNNILNGLNTGNAPGIPLSQVIDNDLGCLCRNIVRALLVQEDLQRGASDGVPDLGRIERHHAAVPFLHAFGKISVSHGPNPLLS